MLAPMDQREALGGRCQRHGPIERRISAAENDQPPAGQLPGIRHPILDLIAFEGLGAGHAQAARLEGAQACRDHHRADGHDYPAGGAHRKVARRIGQYRRDLLAEMKLGIEGSDLLHQPLHQLLRSTHRQCRNVIDGLVGIQLRALAADHLERVEDMRLNAEQP